MVARVLHRRSGGIGVLHSIVGSIIGTVLTMAATTARSTVRTATALITSTDYAQRLAHIRLGNPKVPRNP
jgi:hypothetical protein